MRRRVFHHLFRLAVALCALACCTVLGGLLWFMVQRGGSAVSWTFLVDQMREAGAHGGIYYNILGTGILVGTALVITLPIAISLALLHGVYLRGHRWRRHLTLMLYILNGVPAILFGIFGLIVFVNWLGWEKSWLTGGILLALIILPTVTVSLMERIASLPSGYIESAAGLGLSQSQVIRSVILPQSMGGLITGSLLGLARAAGETAPIMFTATVFAGATVPSGVKDNPVLSLPYHIFNLAQDSANPIVAQKVWATALTLLALVFLLSLIALPARLKIHEEAHHG